MKPLLAATADDDLQSVSYPCYASRKIDGVRCLFVDGQAVSRSIKPIPNEFVQSELHTLIDALPGGLQSLDGELIVGDPTSPEVFGKTMSGVMSRGGTPDFVYYVFDLWDFGEVQYAGRYTALNTLIDKFLPTTDRIQAWKHSILHDERQVRMYEAEAVSEGYEGIMLRSPDGAYKFGRSTKREGILQKVKRQYDMEGVVTGFTELQHNENEATQDALGHQVRSTKQGGLVGGGTLGALVLRLNEPFEGKILSVGSGFNLSQRQEIWENRDKYLNEIVTFKYNPTVADLPRFPIFLHFRKDL